MRINRSSIVAGTSSVIIFSTPVTYFPVSAMNFNTYKIGSTDDYSEMKNIRENVNKDKIVINCRYDIVNLFGKSVHFEKAVKHLNSLKKKLSDNKKVEEDLARSYLQARIRFYGTSYKNKKKIKWNKIDTLILLLSIIIFLIFFLLR